MRIAVDARAFEKERTGIGRYLEGLLASWLQEYPADELTLLSPRPIFLPETLQGQVAIVPALARLPGTLWLQTLAPLEAKRAGAQIFFGPNAVVPLGSPLPRVATIHDLTPLLFPEWHNVKQRLGMVPFLPAVVREAAHLFCVSRATRLDLMKRFPEAEAKSSVVWNGLTSVTKEEASPDANRPDVAEPYILYLGTREPRKNLARLVSALEEIWDRRPVFPRLVIAGGSGWGMQDFETRVRDSRHHRRIQILGYVSPASTRSLLEKASALAYPSLYEGFGFPPLEALAAGIPVVASSSSSLPEVLGDLALLPDPSSTPAIGEALERALDDSEFRERARTAGPPHAAAFTWARAVQSMRPVFLSAIGGGP